MDLSGVISISGRPGLYKVVAQGKNSIIVQSLMDNKRFPAYSTDRISALEDISIYTYEDDKPLKDILSDIYAKTGGKESPSHKEDIASLQDFLSDILPNYDEERVYPSDIKKLFQWYNLLLKSGNLEPVVETEPEVKAEEETKEVEAKEKAPKKAPTKKAPASKPPAKKKTIPNKESSQKTITKKIVSKKPISKKK